jgi:hypothetical protein
MKRLLASNKEAVGSARGLPDIARKKLPRYFEGI